MTPWRLDQTPRTMSPEQAEAYVTICQQGWDDEHPRAPIPPQNTHPCLPAWEIQQPDEEIES